MRNDVWRSKLATTKIKYIKIGKHKHQWMSEGDTFMSDERYRQSRKEREILGDSGISLADVRRALDDGELDGVKGITDLRKKALELRLGSERTFKEIGEELNGDSTSPHALAHAKYHDGLFHAVNTMTRKKG